MKTIQLYGLFVILIGALSVSACTNQLSDTSDDQLVEELENQLVTTATQSPRAFQKGVVHTFDPTLGEFPEGVAMDREGNLYVGLAPLGKILRIKRDGSTETVATLGSQLLGLTVDAKGIIYAAVNAPFTPDNGVWRIDPKNPTQPKLLPGTENIFFPNSLTFDRRGNLYVTSTTGPPLGDGTFGKGSIWRIPPGGKAEPWLAGELLTGLITNLIPQPLPLGANGIVHRKRTLYVANTSKKHVVRIPIDSKGDPGEPEMIASFAEDPGSPDLGKAAGAIDGITVDSNGSLYLLLIAEHRVVRISPDGSLMTTVATTDNSLHSPASAVFGTTGGDQTALFLTNFALPTFPNQPTNATGPAVVKVDVGIPGMPQ